MTNKKFLETKTRAFLFGLAAMTLVFGLAVIGCDKGDDDDDGGGGGGGGGTLSLSDFVGTYGAGFVTQNDSYVPLTVTGDSLSCGDETISGVTTSAGGAGSFGVGTWIYLHENENKIGIAYDYPDLGKYIYLGTYTVGSKTYAFNDKPTDIVNSVIVGEGMRD
jgi:hypothetical protein